MMNTKNIKKLMLAVFGMLFLSGANAATIEATNMTLTEGVDYITSDYFDLDLTAHNISDGTTNTSISESFILNSSFNLSSNTYEGSLSVGSLLVADVVNLTVSNNHSGGAEFSADLIYLGGSLMGSLSNGSLSGSYTVSGDVLATVAEVQAVPVPAAVWLFGSGLLGFVAIARRKSA